MRQIQITPISGSLGRPSLFGFSVEQSRSFHPTLSGSFWMGQTPSDWYRRAKESIAKFDSLIGRMNRIANPAERKAVQEWVGSPSNEDSRAYRRRSVESDLRQDVEAFTPPNISAYTVDRRTNRIEKLEEINANFETRVANAELVYGQLPLDQVKTQEQLVAQTTTPGWVLPVAIGVGTLGIAALVTILSGKGKR
jgi:hypothetical protein